MNRKSESESTNDYNIAEVAEILDSLDDDVRDRVLADLRYSRSQRSDDKDGTQNASEFRFEESTRSTPKSKVENLMHEAEEALRNAQNIVPEFPVGAAVLTNSGNMYKGCNVESEIAGLGTCAERNAVNSALANGETDFIAIAVVSETNDLIWPCGACRQYLSEFARLQGHDIECFIDDDNLTRAELSELLPKMQSFTDKRIR